MAVRRLVARSSRKDVGPQGSVLGTRDLADVLGVQEWFIYHTLLGEPWLLNLLELAVLLLGSVVEGVVIAFVLARDARQVEDASAGR